LAAERITAPEALTRLQHEQTLDTLRTVDPTTAFPIRPPTRALHVGAVAALMLLPALALSNPQIAALDRRAAQQEAIAEAIEQIEATQHELAEDASLSEAERAAALQALNEALSKLQDMDSTPAERQAALTEAERQLAELRAPEAATRVQRLAEAAPLSSDATVQPLAEALAAGELDSAAAYLDSLLDAEGDPMTAEEVLALADAFNEMADALQETDPEMAAQFREIAQEIYAEDATGAQEAVARAAETLSEAAEANAPNEALEQAQAGLQEAQSTLRGSQAEATDASAGGSPQGGQPSAGNGGAPDASAGASAGGEGDGAAGGPGSHQDAGSSAPFGDEELSRLERSGGEITLPRPQTEDGAPQSTVGRPGASRVPYREAYADYVEAAEADLSRQAYPPGLRTYVRQYFSDLGE
jgi:chemotaxis protein histidine kinase CheA